MILRIALGQINMQVGNLAGNAAAILKQAKAAERAGADLIVFPEKALTGYPLEDLALRQTFLKNCRQAMDDLARSFSRSPLIMIVGGVELTDELFNAAAVIHRGKILGWARKRHLFCCGRIDESRYFSAGDKPLVIETEIFRAAVSIGDDFAYPVFPGETELLINLWNEPYHFAHRPLRERMMIERAREDAVAIALISPVGGQDDLVFEGSSTVVDGFGEVLARGRNFAEDLLIADLDLRELKAHRARTFHSSRPEPHHLEKAVRVQILQPWPETKRPARVKARIETPLKGNHELFTALTLALHDFIEKNHFAVAVLGLSGGIDSALTAVLAREALGPRRVIAVSMPGPYTSDDTRSDAKKIAKNLGVKFLELPISPAYKTILKTLEPAFRRKPTDVTEENLQARIRGQILMALANKFHGVVLATGNKSEAATGYCTLYGDTCGAFAPLKDVYKTQVYELAEWYNRHARRPLIPQSVIERPPSAELRPNQTDQDTLPPYEDLDRILQGLLEKDESVSELIENGEDPEMVTSVLRMFLASEFKRRQYPIGPAVSEAPLSECRFPLTKVIAKVGE